MYTSCLHLILDSTISSLILEGLQKDTNEINKSCTSTYPSIQNSALIWASNLDIFGHLLRNFFLHLCSCIQHYFVKKKTLAQFNKRRRRRRRRVLLHSKNQKPKELISSMGYERMPLTETFSILFDVLTANLWKAGLKQIIRISRKHQNRSG